MNNYFDICTGPIYDPTYHPTREWRLEKETNMNVKVLQSPATNIYRVICDDLTDLSVDHVLTTLSAMKAKMAMSTLPDLTGSTSYYMEINKVVCYMTPSIRRNIILASKKLERYGKPRPIIARFDEWGNRLPDEIHINGDKGITLKIVNDSTDYLELEAHLSTTMGSMPSPEELASAYTAAFSEDDLKTMRATLFGRT